MRKIRFLSTHILAISVFLSAGLGCSRFISRPDNTATGNTAGSNVSSANTSASPDASNRMAPANTGTAPAATRKLDGNYSVSGTNINGQGNYQGTLTITSRGDVYQFSWDVAGSKYDGVGVQTEDAVAVSYAGGANGKGCGVALYRINADGSLDGKAGYWGVNEGEAELAKRLSGSDLGGEYEVTGTNPDGREYKSKMTIAPSGPGFIFKWSGTNNVEGVGVRQGNFVAAGFGGKQCSFVSYQIKADGSLDGKWGGPGTVTFGTEKALKK